MKKYTGEMLLLIVTFIAASGWFFSKYSLEDMPTMGFIGLRFSLAALIFLPFSFHAIKSLGRSQQLKASSVGLAYIVTMILWISGLIYSEDLGESAFIYSLSMLIAPLTSWLLFKHQPKITFWFALPIATLGLYFLSIKQGFIHFSLSNILFLFSSISAALYFVLNNQYAKEVDSLPLTTIQLGIVGISASIYSLLFEQWLPPPTETWFWFLASVLVATNIRVLLQTVAQRRCHVNTAAIIMLLEPVWTLILGWLVLKENIFPTKIIGCLLIFSAIFIYRFNAKKERS
ncbi:RhaT protein [Rodentibacter caecimuris]|uniref:RhaT protein n=1 Tax=Rodentibacter caecimuris TaxID=1796644 RepID=A0A9X8YXZ8_9PAST|nr:MULTISPECIES: DMT family transporter [Pasteurellaceae]AOF53963.1 Permease of the drug/metabolite transporter (DMT) superfamily [Pasteurellaceae bacterium NI1060]MCQ9124588.1 DMT family transporter [Rodentibacter heylii]MCR1837396.1 DMT family transporter [Pasteurella caecimuris]MCU0107771.1 DMT family transporter [Pasteurella caecimuris]MCX2960578.1 DMT family transporter [Rodentibacter heylii]